MRVTLGLPSLVIGAEHDTTDPAYKRAMAGRLPQGSYLHCPDGSHLAIYDDQEVDVTVLIDWLTKL